MDLGKWIRTHRERNKWSQRELANRLNTDAGSVSRHERDIRPPDLLRFRQLCELFGASADDALGLSKRRPQKRGAA